MSNSQKLGNLLKNIIKIGNNFKNYNFRNYIIRRAEEVTYIFIMKFIILINFILFTKDFNNFKDVENQDKFTKFYEEN